jgi:hypothetical protein
MLFIDRDELGLVQYMVTNDAGLCLIRTRNKKIADYVNYYSYGAPLDAQIAVGGDRNHPEMSPIWRYQRKIR